jgi:sarcosine oxidase subunit alpha
MSQRIEAGVARGAALTILIDDVATTAYPGETLAAAMLATGRAAFRADTDGRPRGLFCNMGTCGECMVEVERAGRGPRILRACLVPVEAGLVVRRRAVPHG